MKRRGTIRKRTVRLHCEGQALVAGTDIMLDDVRIGAVTSSAGSTALAVMRLDRLEDARVVQVAGHDAQVDLPDGS